ncbi:MAG: prepilin-type N-terminal cleavage/methylation domain-containing protein [Deltaproteobacteria bacterium]|nr:prepilin-type N-terminal cleavage/methylation domain-containing protein [Deltaproteobacteria bacterium]
MGKSLSRLQGKEEGFTLVELLIVVAIIAILAAIAIPQFSQYRKRGYVAMLNADAKNAYTAAQAFLIDNPTITTPTIANLATAGYTPSAQVTATTNMTQSSGTITITGGPWGLTTSVAIIDYNGSITPAAP